MSKMLRICYTKSITTFIDDDMTDADVQELIEEIGTDPEVINGSWDDIEWEVD